jgi:hypothetical protein
MRHMPPQFCLLAVTDLGCSCSLYGGSSTDEEQERREIEHRRRKYKKKGWSSAKIERAIGDLHHRQPSPSEFLGIRPDLRHVLADVAEQVGELALVVHFYEGHITTEKVAIAVTSSMSPAALRAGTTPIVEDAVVWVRKSR